MSKLYAEHQAGNKTFGFDVQNVVEAEVRDSCKTGVYDLFLTRYWGIKLATNAVNTVLRVDQVTIDVYISCL